ncbi:MAG: FliM/FliN family flagellar motor switch protein [Acidobacteriaceae bacterium]|nr:FliM/FliN family flagellar motor switch protein [Acidobacteriaceae bacterium]
MDSLEKLQLYDDVWIDFEAQLGRTSLTLRQILDLDRGSVVLLPRSGSEDLDLLIGGVPVGQGEILAQQALSVRITGFREEH